MKALIASLTLVYGLTVGLTAAAEEEKSKPVIPQTEATVALNCDTLVPGSTCPAKYSANVGLLTDTIPRGSDRPASSSPTDK